MFCVIRFIAGMFNLTPVLALISEITIGGMTFVGVMYFLWVLEGRPAGPESVLLESAVQYVKLPP
jgi:hypothetical protein